MKKGIMVGLLAIVGVSAQAVLITDDFNRLDTAAVTGNMTDIGTWESTATWKIGGEELDSVTTTDGNYYALNNALETSDGAFTLKGTVIVDSSNAGAYFGMTWNYHDNVNNYRVRYFINGTTQVLRSSAVEGARTIKNVAGAFTPVNARGYEIAVTSAAADSFSLTITDTVTALPVYTTSWTDSAPSLAGGFGGFHANNAGSTFDDFSLDAIPEPMTMGLMGTVAFGLVFVRRRLLI